MINKILIILIPFLFTKGYSQSIPFDFSSFVKVEGNYIIHLKEDEIFNYKELNKMKDENIPIEFILKKTSTTLDLLEFYLEEKIDDNCIKNTYNEYQELKYGDFIKKLSDIIIQKNNYLRNKKIRKAVYYDNLIYPPVILKIELNSNKISYYKVSIYYQSMCILSDFS